MTLDQLKNFNADRMDLEQLVEMSAYASTLTEEYTRLKMPAPEWLEEQSKAVVTEIARRDADRRAARLKELKSRRAQLRTIDEKRQDLDAEIQALEATV